MRTVSREANLSTGEVALYVGVPIALLVLAGLLIASRSANRDTRLMAEEASAGGGARDRPGAGGPAAGRPAPPPTGAPSRSEGGFPIPPMDLKVPPSPRLRRQPVASDGAPVVSTGRRGATTTARRTAMSDRTPAAGRAARSSAPRAAAASGRPSGTACCPHRPGLRRHLRADVPQGDHRAVPVRAEGDQAALPRPARAQPAPRRAGEVRRLRAVRLGLPGRRDLRRGRRQHRGRPLLAR